MTERNKVSHKITSSPKIVVCASGSSMIHATARQNSIGKRILRILIFNFFSPFILPNRQLYAHQHILPHFAMEYKYPGGNIL